MQKIRSLFIIASLFVCSFDLQAAFNVQEFTTSKGIRVRYREDTTTPVISLNFSIEHGSAYDPKGLEGTATLLASMMTEGTKSKSVEELAAYMQDLAIKLSHKADLEYFSGTLTTLRKNKDKAFALLKETLFDSAFTEEAFKRAKKEILTILAMNEDDPGYQITLNTNKILYKEHPFARPTLGTAESVQKIKISDLKDFMTKFSRKKLLVAVAGNITREEIEKHVDNLFGHLPKETKVDDIADVKHTVEEVRKLIRKKIPQTIMAFVQKGLRYDDEKFLTLVLLNKILSEKLRLRVREKKGLTYHVSTSLQSNKKIGLLGGSCATKNKSAQQAIQSILAIFSEIKEKGCTDQEFEDAKSYSMGSYILNFEDTPGISRAILGLMQIERSPEYMDIRNDLMEKITKEDIETLATEILDPEHMTIVMYGNPEDIK